MGACRKSRYVSAGVDLAPNPLHLEALELLSENQILTLQHLTTLSGRSYKGMQRTMRRLLDAGLVSVIPIPRAALSVETDHTALFGTAPNIYALTKRGAKTLMDAECLEELPPIPALGVKNALFVAHELMIRDVRVWLHRICQNGVSLTHWASNAPRLLDARPDAYFIVQLPRNALVGLVEADRSTERGGVRWGQKCKAYAQLFASGKLRELTGYQRARVLVVVPDTKRRNRLAALIAELSPTYAERYWITEQATLELGDLSGLWLNQGEEKPLIPEEFR